MSYGEKACEYLLGPAVVRPYRWLWVAAVLVGAVLPIPIVWSAADITNALMAIPNLISLLALSGVIVSETRAYLWSGELERAAPAGGRPATESDGAATRAGPA
jgi:AGCS family alanine or glycine:cation symporter